MKSLHLGLTALGAFFLSLSAPQAVQAQAPVLDGVIGANEYGSSYKTGDQMWYMTWDNTNLYVATTNANTDEASILYFDTNPFIVVNGGDNSLGTTAGVEYNNTNGKLPFRADAVVYIKASTDLSPDNRQNGGPVRRITRKADPETGELGPEIPIPAENVAINGGVREFSIPWSAISTTNARPANFNWFGYIANGRGYVYAQVPFFNPSSVPTNEVIGTNASFVRYFTTLNTAATGSTNNAFGPNNLDSYTHVGVSDGSFGPITVYDFTLNTPGASITRRSVDSSNPNLPIPTWDIRNNLVVGNGTLTAGPTTAAITVGNDFVVGLDGSFNHSTVTAELKVSGDFVVDGGFAPNSGTVELAGATGDVSISNAFPNLLISGRKTLTRNLFSTGVLRVANGGRLTSNGSIVFLNQGARLIEGTDGYISGIVETAETIIGSGVNDFKGIGLSLNPAVNSAALGFTRVRRLTGTFVTGEASSRSLTRQYLIEPTKTTGLNTSLTFGYRDAPSDVNELNGNDETRLVLFSSPNNQGPFQPLGASSRSAASNTVTLNNLTTLNGYYTVSDSNNPLPVELISFTGKAENSAARLNWATASEKQNKGFEVERRTDQSEWQTLGFVAGNGTTNQRHDYSYVDRAPAAGNNYYRLRQIDLDGKSVYSQPVTVQVGAVAFTLSPVPASDVLTINGLGAGQHTAEIYNSRGQRVLSKEFKDDAANTVAVSTLPAGVYMVRVLGANRSTRNARFIKE